MKKLIITLVAVVALFLSLPVIASDYIVVKEGDRVVVYDLSLSGSEHYYISTYNLINPTVSQLSGTGLPSNLWGLINGQDGIYDTRLVKAGRDLDEMKANYENEHETVNYLEDQMEWRKVYMIFITIAFVAMVVVAIVQRSTITTLKRN